MDYSPLNVLLTVFFCFFIEIVAGSMFVVAIYAVRNNKAEPWLPILIAVVGLVIALGSFRVTVHPGDLHSLYRGIDLFLKSISWFVGGMLFVTVQYYWEDMWKCRKEDALKGKG